MSKKPTYDELKQRINWLEALIKNSQIAIVQLTADHVITEINPEFTRLFGFEQNEVVGQKIDSLLVPVEYLQEAQWLTKQTIKGETIHKISKRKRKDGVLKDVEIFAGPLIVDDRVVGCYGQYKDISNDKQAEEALRASEEKYRSILENMEEGYWEVDLAGNFTFVNDSACKILGYSRDEMLKMNNRMYTTPENAVKIYKIFNKVYRTGQAIKITDYEVINKDGSKVITEGSVSLLRDSNGYPIGFRGSNRDVTERKKAEEALRASEAKLARSKKMESLGLLAGGVAHDLNNVLSGIVGYPQLLLMDLPEDSELRKPIENIQASGQRATAIVQDLLTVAKGVASTKKPLNLNDLIKDYLDSPEFNKLEQNHPTVTVKVNLGTELLEMQGSPVHIRKVVMNLVSNAMEAIEDYGHVIVATGNRYMDKPLRGYDHINTGEYVVLSVSDNGLGISPDDMERIFDPFYTKKISGRSGTGLGLAVVWNVVQDHKGYIDVISGEKGTTFVLYFPIARGELPVGKLSTTVRDYQGRGETILVVDDVESQREISCKMLETLGYQTMAVSSGEEAVEYMRDHEVDLILLDMIMEPGINGLETYERIIKIHPRQKAVIVSGFAKTDEVRKAQRLGAGKYIKKPLTLEKIGQVVKEELQARLLLAESNHLPQG